MSVTDRLWQQHLDPGLRALREARPRGGKVLIFGSPARAQHRVLLLARAVEAEGYEVERVDPVAASPFFTVTRAHFKSSPGAPAS